MAGLTVEAVLARSLRAHALAGAAGSIYEALLGAAGVYRSAPTSHLSLDDGGQNAFRSPLIAQHGDRSGYPTHQPNDRPSRNVPDRGRGGQVRYRVCERPS